jgi:hypothetical protein
MDWRVYRVSDIEGLIEAVFCFEASTIILLTSEKAVEANSHVASG